LKKGFRRRNVEKDHDSDILELMFMEISGKK
jgi:hypothetical protein